MKVVWVTTVVGLWIYGVFLRARWQMATQCHEGRRSGFMVKGWIKMYVKVSGLVVLGWLIFIMG